MITLSIDRRGKNLRARAAVSGTFGLNAVLVLLLLVASSNGRELATSVIRVLLMSFR